MTDMETDMETVPAIISGDSCLKSSIRPISAQSEAISELSDKRQSYLDVAEIFEKIFPDLNENSLGERRDVLIRQAENIRKKKLHQENLEKEYYERELYQSTSESRSDITVNTSATRTTSYSQTSSIEKDYQEDEEWHQQIVEYLAKATEDYNEIDDQLSRAERYIMETRGRAASADESRRAHHLHPIDGSPFVSFLDENHLKEGIIPNGLILPSEFYPQHVREMEEMPPGSPRYRRETASTKAALAETEKKWPPPEPDRIEIESKTSDVEFRSLKPRVPKQQSAPAKPITEPGLTHRGYSRLEDEEHKSLERHLERIRISTFDFLRNPRSEAPKISKVFEAIPAEIRFQDWEVGTVIETVLELRNNDATSRAVTVLPPENPHFHLGLGRYPSSDGQVGPGLSVLFRIQFMPDSLADDESSLEVRHQAGKFNVPIRAIRAKPVLSLPEKIDIGHCLVNSSKRYLTRIINSGGRGKFCFVKPSEWPTANFKTAVEPGSTTIGPFTIWPSMFELESGDEKDLMIQFEPLPGSSPGIYDQKILLTCDNCQTKELTLTGRAETPAVEVNIDDMYNCTPRYGELHDQFSLKRIRIPNGYPGSSPFASFLQFSIRNLTHVDLPFNFTFGHPKLISVQPDDSTDRGYWNVGAIKREEDVISPFKIYPTDSTNQMMTSLPPDSETKFSIYFNPNESGYYNTVLRLSLFEDNPSRSVISENTSKSTLEYELIAECKPIQVQILPQVMNIPGEIPAGSRLKREFHLINKTPNDDTMHTDVNKVVKFHWKQSAGNICSIEPAFGTIAPGQSLPLQLCIEADKWGTIEETLECNIEYGDNLYFQVSARIKEPKVQTSISKIDFDVVEVYKKKQVKFKIINRNPIKTFWSIETDNPDIILVYDQQSKWLEPLEETDVTVTWTPTSEYCLDDTFLKMEGFQYKELLLQGDALRPLVEFETTSLAIEDTFVGVKAKIELTLVNKSLIKSYFKIIDSKLLPSLPDTLDFWPSEDSDLSPLEALQSRKIEIEIISHKKQKFENFIIAVDIINSSRPALIEIIGVVRTLEVEVTADNQICKSIDFQLNSLFEIKSKKIKIQNKTGIKSNFRIKAKRLHGVDPAINYKCDEFNWIGQEVKIENKKSKKMNESRPTSHVISRDFVKQMNSKSKYGITIITDKNNGILNPFEYCEMNIIVSATSWGEFDDILQLEIDDMDIIELKIHISAKVAPIISPSSFVRFGGVPASESPIKRIPLTNLAPHPICINFYLLDTLEKSLYLEYGEIPIALDDEDEPLENSIYNYGSLGHSLGRLSERKMPFQIAQKVRIEAEKQVYLEIKFDSKQARLGSNAACLFGELSLDEAEKRGNGLFNRPTGLSGPHFEMGCSGISEANLVQIETIDELVFNSTLGNFKSQKRAISVFNPTRSSIKFKIKTKIPFSISDGLTQSTDTVSVYLGKGQRKVYYCHFDPTIEIIENMFISNSNTLSCCQLLYTQELALDHQFQVQAMISLPNLKISKNNFDFSLRTIGGVFKLECSITNDSSCEGDFWFDNCCEIFSVIPSEGRVRRGEACFISIMFTPKAEEEYKTELILNLYNQKHIINITGQGTLDNKYTLGSSLFY